MKAAVIRLLSDRHGRRFGERRFPPWDGQRCCRSRCRPRSRSEPGGGRWTGPRRRSTARDRTGLISCRFFRAGDPLSEVHAQGRRSISRIPTLSASDPMSHWKEPPVRRGRHAGIEGGPCGRPPALSRAAFALARVVPAGAGAAPSGLDLFQSTQAVRLAAASWQAQSRRPHPVLI